MNLQNLYEGQVIKNYKELCALLDIKEKAGNQKILQFLELDRHFKLKRDGQRIIVEQVYSQSFEKIDKRKLGNRSIYVDDIAIQLLDYLTKNKKKEILYNDTKRVFLTSSNIFLITGMINDKYVPTKQSIRAFIEEEQRSLEIEDLNEFFVRTEHKMRQILITALDILEAKYIIKYDVRDRIQDENGWRMATDKEDEYLLDIRNEVAKDMDVRRYGMVYYLGRSAEFHKRVKAKISKELGWTGIYSGFLIGYGKRLETSLEDYRKEFKEISDLRYSLNGNLISFINKDAEKKYKKNKEEYEEALNKIAKMIETTWGEVSTMGDGKSKKEIKLYKNEWRDNQFYLTDKLLKLPKK